MNPRQRRGVMLMVFAGFMALVLFFVVTRYVSTVNSKVGPMVTVHSAAANIPAYSVIQADQLKTVEVPKRWVSPKSEVSTSLLVGRRIAFGISKGTYVGVDMLLPPSELDSNEREVALNVDAKTGVAGRIASGDHVDVLAVFTDETHPQANTAKLVARNVRVISVGGVVTRSTQTSRTELAAQQVVPVTLALSQDQTFSVSLADATAATVRLIGLPQNIAKQNRSSEATQMSEQQLLSSGGRG